MRANWKLALSPSLTSFLLPQGLSACLSVGAISASHLKQTSLNPFTSGRRPSPRLAARCRIDLLFSSSSARINYLTPKKVTSNGSKIGSSITPERGARAFSDTYFCTQVRVICFIFSPATTRYLPGEVISPPFVPPTRRILSHAAHYFRRSLYCAHILSPILTSAAELH